ncbi:hypothetical protein A2U01_0093404, partial [Trifolium medium]|nr:hypothetical protein [Trifolium medium]
GRDGPETAVKIETEPKGRKEKPGTTCGVLATAVATPKTDFGSF